MTDLSYMDPQIEVAANAPRLQMIMQRLKDSGLRPIPATAPVDLAGPSPLLMDIASISRETVERTLRARMMGDTRPLVILDSGNALDLTDAMMVTSDNDLSLIKGRLAANARRAARTAEVDARRDTAKSLGAPLPAIDPDTRPHLLYLGDGSPVFLSLQGALAARGIDVTAALSTLTAREYMAQNRFAAAIVDLTPRAAHGSDFIDWAASGGALTSLPVLALTDPATSLTPTQQNMLALAAEILTVSDQTAARIEHLARRYLASKPPLPTGRLSSKVSDIATGLFSQQFMNAHLPRQMETAATRGEPLSMLTLKLTGVSATDRAAHTALKPLADKLKFLLRDTDCAAVISFGAIGVSLPATPYRGGVQLAERVEELVNSDQALRSLKFEWRVVERRAYHTAKTFIGAGLTGPFHKVRAA